jgi:hypothetical protein
MTAFLYSTFFAITCLWATFRNSFWSLAIFIYMFPLEQVLQSGIPFLTTGRGLEVINYSIACVVGISVFVQMIRVPNFFYGWANTSNLTCLGLFLWAILSVIWSPAKALILNYIYSGIPYLIMTLLGSLLVNSILDLFKTSRAMLLLGIPMALIYLISPEFDMSSGRLNIRLSSDVNSNVLAVGEFGGLLIISAILYRPKEIIGILNFPVRIILVILGAIISLQSGSRGQFFGAIAVSLLLIPVASQIKSILSLISILISTILISIIIYYVYSITLGGLQSFAVKRFDINELLFGVSSAEGRLSNIQTLFFAWISSPIAYLIGLGTGAFSTITSSGEDYPHNLLAEVAFELGIIGFLLLFICLISAGKSCFQLFIHYRNMQEERSAVTLLIGYIAYEFILANKQGALWGVPILFLFTSIAGRLEKRIILEEESNQVDNSNLTEPNSVLVSNGGLNIQNLGIK